MSVTTMRNHGMTLREKIIARPPGMENRPEKKSSDADPLCKKCGGYGYTQASLKLFDDVQCPPRWFVCACIQDMRNKFLAGALPKIDYSRIGLREDEIDNLTWDKVIADSDISDAMSAVDVVRPAYQRGHGMILIWGTWGQGKTLIGKVLTASAFRDGKRCAYANMSSVLDDIRLAFDEREHKSTELIRRTQWWIERDVLFIDELDKSNDTTWARERMFQLLDQRYALAVREQALTVIASNQGDDDLDGYLRSRLNDNRLGPVIHLNGNDGRQSMTKGYRF